MEQTSSGPKHDERARGALKAMGYSDEEATERLVRGNLQWQFVATWGKRAVFAWAVYWVIGRPLLAFLLGREKSVVFVSWPIFGAFLAAGIVALYVLGARWARQEFERYDTWVDHGDSYRPVVRQVTEER